jgi:K+-sensing histidine kinase KdpD
LIARIINRTSFAPISAGGSARKTGLAAVARARGYVLAGLALVGAFAVRKAFDGMWADRLAYAWFFMAVLVVTRFASAGPQIFTVVGGAVLGNFFFVQPRGSWQIAAELDQFNTVIYFGVCVSVLVVSAREKRQEAERERLIKELQAAMAEVKTLSGLLPICAQCKKIRDDRGYWNQIETFIGARSNAKFSHGICPDCVVQLYPDLHWKTGR